MEKIDLATNSKSIEATYEKVIRGDPNVTFAIFSADKNVLRVGATGSGGIEEFVEEFEDGKVQFGIARVTAENSSVSKNLLVGWCPDGAPSKARLSFASNSAEVARILNGYHVQVTARDQDDLDPEELLQKVGAAAGANYGGQGAVGKAARPPSKPQAAKPSTFVPPKPSLPKSTGKPVASAPQETKKTTVATEDDEWGGEKELEERDFQTQPLENVPTAYEPTKVNMEELRKQRPDTISSVPRENKVDTKATTEKEEGGAKPLSERVKTYDDTLSEGRLSSLPKPKTSHSVMSRFQPESSTESASGGTPVKTAAFGAKPNFGTEQVDPKKDKLVGGTSRNFAAEGGKSPAQIWAEKRGKFTTVPLSEEPLRSDTNETADKFATTTILEKISMVDKQNNQKPVPEFNGADDSKDKPGVEAEPPAPGLPQRNFSQIKKAISEEQEKPPAPPARDVPQSLPSRNQAKAEVEEVPPAPPARNKAPSLSEQDFFKPDTQAESAPAPSVPSRDPKPTPANEESHVSTITALAEYDYEKDEENEIGFVEGDLIVGIEFADEEWWSGINSRTGENGLFPATYVSLQGDTSNSANKTSDENQADTKDSKSASAIAEYDYEKDEDNELSFAEGDEIINIDFIDKDWWSGTLAKTGEVGLFPANYVTLKE